MTPREHKENSHKFSALTSSENDNSPIYAYLSIYVFSVVCGFVHSSSGANDVEFVSALCFYRQGEHIANEKIKGKK